MQKRHRYASRLSIRQITRRTFVPISRSGRLQQPESFARRRGHAQSNWPDDAASATGTIFASCAKRAQGSLVLAGAQEGPPRSHRQTEAPSCLAFAISALLLTSLIFRFACPRLQKARALLGSSRIATLKSAMARSWSPLYA